MTRYIILIAMQRELFVILVIHGCGAQHVGPVKIFCIFHNFIVCFIHFTHL